MLVAHLENLPLSHGLLNGLADFFACDIRHSLHFVQANLAHWANPSPPVAQWRWHAAKTPEDADAELAESQRSVAAWSRWPLRSFDMMTSNLLNELSSSESALVAEEDKTREDKLADAAFMGDLSAVMDAVSMADLWSQQADQEVTDVYLATHTDMVPKQLWPACLIAGDLFPAGSVRETRIGSACDQFVFTGAVSHKIGANRLQRGYFPHALRPTRANCCAS